MESTALSLSSGNRMCRLGHSAIGQFSTFPAVHAVSTPVIPQIEQPRVCMRCAMIFGKPGYSGPYPPKGDEPHHYHFRLHAISRANFRS